MYVLMRYRIVRVPAIAADRDERHPISAFRQAGAEEKSFTEPKVKGRGCRGDDTMT